MTDSTVLGELAVGVEIHVSAGACRCGLSEVESVNRAVVLSIDEEAAAAQIACFGQHHGECEADGYRCVDGVAPLLEDLGTYRARQRVPADHHAMTCLRRMSAIEESPAARKQRVMHPFTLWLLVLATGRHCCRDDQ